MKKFHSIQYRCEGCKKIFWVNSPATQPCPNCGVEKYFGDLFALENTNNSRFSNYRGAGIKSDPRGVLKKPLEIPALPPWLTPAMVEEAARRDRTTPAVYKRAMLVYRLRVTEGMTLYAIGRLIQRDHSTIHNLIERAKKMKGTI